MAKPDSYTLPDEYRHVLSLIQQRHNIDILPLDKLAGGRTGAALYLVSVRAVESTRVEHLILKLDHAHEKSTMDEIERHQLAWHQASEEFARQHMAALTYEAREEQRVAILYAIAGQSLHRFRPLVSYERQSQLEDIFAATGNTVLRQWNAAHSIEQDAYPQSLLDRWLGYRLKPEANLGRFLDQVLNVPQDVAGFLIQGELFPNPLAYSRQADLWRSVRSLDIIVGFQHGDLNAGNILVAFDRDDQGLDGYYLIDFSLYKEQMPLLYDLCYLEMSYLVHQLERTSFTYWVKLVTQLAEQGRPKPHKAPVELAGTCAVINAGRKAFARWLEETHPSLGDDLWGQYWLAAVAAGLNYCNKTFLTERERLGGLVYAAAHLKRFCAQFGLPPPAEVRLLYDPSQAGPLAVSAGEKPGKPSPSTSTAARPTGVMTFLFTDIVGSTRLWQKYPQEMTAALGRHDSILEQSIAAHQGYIFKRAGDGFCAVFQSAGAALVAAITGQRALQAEKWGRTGPLRVRMSLHSGTAEEVAGDYFGADVNRVARLQAVAHGGQILFSEDTRRLLEQAKSPEFAWLDLGRHWLRDLDQPERIYQVIAQDLPVDFPPLPTVGLQTKNLPEQATPFVGRQLELGELEKLLENQRLVTLCGPGGIGKTRLALVAAETMGNHYRQGAYFVPLLSIDSPTAVVPAIGNAFDLTFLEGRPPEAQLLDYLRPRQMLLVLDNMEHLLGEEGPPAPNSAMLALVEAMLSAAPALKILVTSRELLRIPQEKPFLVRGLPRGDEVSGLAAAQDDALQLFRLRAQPVSQQVRPADLPHVQQICRLVEGMPLAIELAAAQLRLLSIAEIATEIQHNLDVLDTGLRGAGTRHGSVRVVFENSWRRLREDEQTILARLAVFRGGFTHLAAAAVARATIADLARLVDKSLIKRGPDGRFTLHALIQMFAAEKLAGMTEEMDQTRGRHSRYYGDLLDRAVREWRSCYETTAIDAATTEVDNLRAGWNWILDQREWAGINAYLDNLWQFFKLRGRLPEAMELLDQALQAVRTAEPAAEASYQAHWERQLGQAHLRMSQLGEGDEHFRQSLALLGWPIPDSQVGLIKCIVIEYVRQALHRAWPGRFVGRWEEGRARVAEAYSAYVQLGNRAVVENQTLLAFYVGFRSLNLAEAAGLQPQMARAYALTAYMYALVPFQRVAGAYLSKALPIVEVEPSPEAAETVFRVAGFYRWSLGQWHVAEADFKRAAKAATELGWHWELESNWVGLLMVTHQRGEFGQGLEYAQRIGVSANRRGDAGFIAAALYWQAFFKLRQGGDPGQIVQLLLESAAAPAEVMNDPDWVIVYSSLAHAYMRLGQAENALKEANRASDVIAAIYRPTNPLALFGYADVASVYLDLWASATGDADQDSLQRSARRACEALNIYKRLVPAGKSLIGLYQGLHEWLAGRPQKAHATWRKELVSAEALAIPYDQARLHFQIGRHLEDGERTKGDWGRKEHLRRAAEIFTEIGANYDLAQAKTVLDE